MANDEHVALLKQGVGTWNAWRNQNSEIYPNFLCQASLTKANLNRASLTTAHLTSEHLISTPLFAADLREAGLKEADLSGADLIQADLKEADLRIATFAGAKLAMANLSGANLREANLDMANLWGADLTGADLSGADLREANLPGANLSGANLYGASLTGANLREANLREANLREASLQVATLVGTDVTGADLTGCRIHGVSAWRLKLDSSTKQQNLIITPTGEPEITVDNVEVAQFIYLMLNNQKVRHIIDTITSKVVLILGRFTPVCKPMLDALRDELRKPERGYVPVVFDFEKSRSQTTVETVTLLARMARFVIADLSDAKSVLQELQAIVPNSPKLAVQPVIISAQDEPGMFDSIEIYRSVAKTYRYDDLAQLTANLDKWVIRPAEAKVSELRGP
jgi:uncharacterized protein YjbI with pentapeptide repeats